MWKYTLPVDRPEFDFFLQTYMNKVGLKDKKQAAIQLSNMLYDIGLDPYADLKDLQGTLNQMNEMIRGLPDTPQALQVKDTLSAMYTNKVGQAMLKRIPQTGPTTDPGIDRMQAMMDRYMPMIIAMNTMAKMASMGSEPQQQQQPQQRQPEKAEIPEEFKEEMESIRNQLEETQALLRQQAEERSKTNSKTA